MSYIVKYIISIFYHLFGRTNMADFLRTSSEKEYTDLMDEYVKKGYSIISCDSRTAELVKYKKKTLHKKIALITVWYTLGLANLVYLLLPNKIEDKVTIKCYC